MKAFYAYPSSLVDVTQVIHAAKSIVSATRNDLELQLWEENDISGRPLTDQIFEGIAKADIFIADITAMNFNVTFEIGYAIGLGTRVYLTRDGNIPRDRALADRIGIFDTLGLKPIRTSNSCRHSSRPTVQLEVFRFVPLSTLSPRSTFCRRLNQIGQ
jgi:hypothetical protein